MNEELEAFYRKFLESKEGTSVEVPKRQPGLVARALDWYMNLGCPYDQKTAEEKLLAFIGLYSAGAVVIFILFSW